MDACPVDSKRIIGGIYGEITSHTLAACRTMAVHDADLKDTVLMPRLFTQSLLTLAGLAAMLSAVAHAEGGIAWTTDFEAAKAQAAKEKKLIFMDIYAEWCPPCKMLEAQTFPDPAVIKLLSEFVPVKVDADKQGDLVEKYSDGSLPTLAVIDANGRLLDSNTGFLDAANLQEWIGIARKAGEEMAALEARVADNPKDAAAGLDLANRYVRTHEGAKALALLKGFSADAVNALPQESQAQFLYTRAMAEFDAEAYEDAVATLRDFATRFEADPRAAEVPQYVMQGLYLAARRAFREDNLPKARELYLEIGKDTSFPGAAETAKMELDRLDLFDKPAKPLDVQEWIVGDAVDLAALKGKVVLLDFFQIADPATEISRPAIEALRDKYKDAGLSVASIAIAFDMLDQQRPDAIGAYVADKNYTHPVALDKDLTKTFLAYAGLGSPWTCIIDKQGKVAYLDFFDEERVPAKVEALLTK